MPETILVVDDDPDIARFVEVNLRSVGYDVLVASDGEEALSRAEEVRPDLVLLDVMMPRVDGVIQATARILQEAVEEYARAEGFVGHVGGDDFVVVLPPDVADLAAARICERFDQEISSFYDREDLKRGYVEVEDRQGTLQRFSLIGVSIGVATTSRRKFSHYGEAVDVATEMKQYAKRQSGSSFAVDRRTI